MAKALRDIYKNRMWYLFITPGMILFSAFIVYPVFKTVYGSFFKWSLSNESIFLGFDNYIKILNDKYFLNSLLISTLFGSTITVLSILLGLISALLVDSIKGWFKYLSRVAIFTPYICSLIVAGVIWKSMLEPNGLIQSAMEMVGIITPAWLSDPVLSSLAIILMTTWQTWGFNMIFYLAGLQEIPRSLYESAMVDGASEMDQFWYITLPLLKPTTLILVVYNTLSNLKMFDQVMGLTRGGPMNATMTSMVYIYQKTFTQHLFGVASAAAVVFALAIFGISLIQMYLLRGQVEYS
jgi:multiple sugar transport system permease protein